MSKVYEQQKQKGSNQCTSGKSRQKGLADSHLTSSHLKTGLLNSRVQMCVSERGGGGGGGGVGWCL